MADMSLADPESMTAFIPAQVSKSLDQRERQMALELYHRLLDPLIAYEQRKGAGLVLGLFVSTAVYGLSAHKWPEVTLNLLDGLATTELGRLTLACLFLVAVLLSGSFGGYAAARTLGRKAATEKYEALMELIENLGEESKLLEHIRRQDYRPEYVRLLKHAEKDVIYRFGQENGA